MTTTKNTGAAPPFLPSSYAYHACEDQRVSLTPQDRQRIRRAVQGAKDPIPANAWNSFFAGIETAITWYLVEVCVAESWKKVTAREKLVNPG